MNQGFEQFLSEITARSVMSGLFSLVIAFAWIVIGFVLLRKVHSPAGLVMGVAGLFKLVRFGCCDVLEHFVLGISVAANSEVPQVI